MHFIHLYAFYLFIISLVKTYDYMGDYMFYFDDKMLIVGGFKKILSLSDKEISFDFKRFVLIVDGDSLVMPYLEDSEVGVKGIIKGINFKYKMVNENV